MGNFGPGSGFTPPPPEPKPAPPKAKYEDISTVDPQYFLLRNLGKFGAAKVSSPNSYTSITNSGFSSTQTATNSLLGFNDDTKKFLEIDAKYLSMLQPSIRIYTSDGIEMKFNSFMSPSDITLSKKQRGAGSGIKSINVEMLGDNTASSQNNYSVKLQIFLSSMAELFSDRGNYTYSDLISRSTPPATSDPCKNVSNPKNLSIILRFGYARPQSKEIPKHVLRAIETQHKSLRLNLFKHTVDFNENGSLNIDIEYHGYVERTISNIDVLELGLTRQERLTLAANEYDLCTQRQPRANSSKSKKSSGKRAKQLATLEKKVKQARTKGYSSFVTKLLAKKQIHRLAILRENIGPGVILKKNLKLSDVSKQTPSRIEAALKNAKDKKDNKLTRDGDIYQLDYFYFGDLMNHIFALAKERSDIKNSVSFVLGTFDHAFTPGAVPKPFSIAKIPISMTTFSSWFLENVIKKGERTQYSLSDFLGDVLRSLVAPSFRPAAGMTTPSKKEIEFPTLQPLFTTTAFMSSSRLNVGNQPLSKVSAKNTPSAKLTNYYIYGTSTSIVSAKTSNEPVLKSGTDKGLVKSVKFKQETQKYAAEVRFANSGNSYQSLLYGTYNATVSLVGCTSFAPGMRISISSSSFEQKKANKIGLGGKYRITKVLNSIKDGKYSTELECKWEAPGS